MSLKKKKGILFSLCTDGRSRFLFVVVVVAVVVVVVFINF